MRIVLFCFFSACGTGYVDPRLEPTLAVLQEQDADFFVTHTDFNLLVNNEQELLRKGAFGQWDPLWKNVDILEPDRDYVRPDGKVFKLNSKFAPSIMAHEIGHALGLEHTDRGLMDSIANDDCLKKEMKCLREALAAAGKQ